MVEVVEVPSERRFSPENSSEDDKGSIDQGDTEHEEGCRHFSPSIDTECPEEQSEEHCPRITHDDSIGGKIEQCSPECASCENEGKHRNLRLIHPRGQCEETERQASDDGEDAHLPRDPIEPVEGIGGKENPDDSEDATPEGEGADESDQRPAASGQRQEEVDCVEFDNASQGIGDRVNPGTGCEEDESKKNLETKAESGGETFQIINECDDGKEENAKEEPFGLECERFLCEEEEHKERAHRNDACRVGEAWALEAVSLGTIEEVNFREENDGEGVEKKREGETDEAREKC